MFTSEILTIISEQASVRFTGKINILLKSTMQHLGTIYIKDGEVHYASYKSVKGIKSIYSAVIDEFESHASLRIIIEPEIIKGLEKNIHFPVGVIKRRATGLVDEYASSCKNRPPANVKLSVNADIISEDNELTGPEYELLCVISDYNRVADIYENCTLLDFEVTNALVSLRRKKALKVIKQKEV